MASNTLRAAVMTGHPGSTSDWNNSTAYSHRGGDFSEAGHTSQINLMQALTSLQNDDPSFDTLVEIQKLDKGQVVAGADDLTRKMYVLMEGRVNLVCTNNEGRRLVITTLEQGAIFGEGALDIASDPHIFAEAATAISIWVIPASAPTTK